MSQQSARACLYWLGKHAAVILLGIVTMPGISISSASELDIDALMAMLAQNKGGLTTFSEKKYIAMLDAPLTASGELLYMAPNHLEKITLLPKPESFILDGDSITISRDNKTRTLSLDRYPEIAIFTESIRGTLAGDRTTLEQSYQLSLTGNLQHWTLTLEPTHNRIRKQIRHILIQGQQSKLLGIEIHQTDGDYSVMQIGEAVSP